MSDSSQTPEGQEERFAPLKRNHACLQCKKRKVKCDAVHPTCSPCMRSYHHAARAAQRNKTPLPPLACTYAEVDGASEDDSPAPVPAEKRKKRTRDSIEGPPDGVRDVEKDALMARITELENRLNGLTPSDSNSSGAPPSRPATSIPSKFPTPSTGNMALDDTSAWLQQAVSSLPQTNPIFGMNPPAVPFQSVAETSFDNFDLGSFFLIPANWPVGLPSPFLLEHLLETFFKSVPHFPRILHRASLLARVKLSPTSPNFPHPSLLHAICSMAAAHTAWVNNVPPESIEDTLERQKNLNISFENSEDFALAQGELAQKSIKNATAICMMGPGTTMLEIAQASAILSEVYYNKSIPLQGWMIAAFGPRLLQSLELMNVNRANPTKEPLLTEPVDAFDREQRTATVWATFIMDAGFSLNSFWSGSMNLGEVLSPFTASTLLFNGKDDNIPVNPQTARTKGMLSHHPVEDPFVLASKASTLVWRCAEWIRTWTQRDVTSGDLLTGLSLPDFIKLVDDIRAFQASVPAPMKNIFKILDLSSSHSFDADILLIHILPNLSLALLYEAMLDWDSPNPYCVQQIQKAFEAIIGVLYLIPSNLDVSLIFTSLTAFSIYTSGRLIANFTQHAIDVEQYGVAMRYRADLQTCQNMLSRYGQKHAIGLMTAKFLEAYVAMPPKNKNSARHCIDFQDFQTWQAEKDKNTSPVDVTGLRHRDSAQSVNMGADFVQQTLSRGSGPSSSSGVTPPTAQTVTPEGSNTFLTDQAGQNRFFDSSFSFTAPSPDTANLLGRMEDSFVMNPFPVESARVAGMFGPGSAGTGQNQFPSGASDLTRSSDLLYGTSVPDKMNLAFGALPVGTDARFTDLNAEGGNMWQGGGSR